MIFKPVMPFSNKSNNLWPFWVTCKYHEQIGISYLTVDCHCILVFCFMYLAPLVNDKGNMMHLPLQDEFETPTKATLAKLV